MSVDGQSHAPVALPLGKTRYSLYRMLSEPPGPVWKGAEYLAPIEIRSPYRPARSESLYRLSYPGPRKKPIVMHYFLRRDAISTGTICAKLAVVQQHYVQFPIAMQDRKCRRHCSAVGSSHVILPYT